MKVQETKKNCSLRLSQIESSQHKGDVGCQAPGASILYRYYRQNSFRAQEYRKGDSIEQRLYLLQVDNDIHLHDHQEELAAEPLLLLGVQAHALEWEEQDPDDLDRLWEGPRDPLCPPTPQRTEKKPILPED